jgi:hypothetical protein
MEEVNEATWRCEGFKAPGPDDFNFNLYKKKNGHLLER